MTDQAMSPLRRAHDRRHDDPAIQAVPRPPNQNRSHIRVRAAAVA